MFELFHTKIAQIRNYWIFFTHTIIRDILFKQFSNNTQKFKQFLARVALATYQIHTPFKHHSIIHTRFKYLSHTFQAKTA